MADREIILKVDKAHFEEVYFRNDNRKVYTHPAISNFFHTTIFVGVFVAGSLIYNFVYDNVWAITIILSVIFLGMLTELYKKAQPFIDWQRNVKLFLNKISECKSYKLVLSEGAISTIRDDEEKFEKWSSIKNGEITDLFISLEGASNILIPRKCMTDEEYNVLKEIVLEKVKNTVS